MMQSISQSRRQISDVNCSGKRVEMRQLLILVMLVRWDAGVVICLERGADLHMAQLMPLPLTDGGNFNGIFNRLKN